MTPHSTPRRDLTAPPVPPDGWQVAIRCPACWRVQGMVTAQPGMPWDVRLATAVRDHLSCHRRGCPPLRWPTEAEVQRVGERAARTPSRRGRMQAHAVAVRVYVGDLDAVMRGQVLGEGPEDVARRAGPDAIALPFED